MDLKKLNGLEGLVSPQPGLKKTPDVGTGPSFRETLLKEIAGGGVQGPKVAGQPGTSGADALKFSNHAIERMQTRGISFDPQDLQRLESAVAKAAAKGSKDSLILMNDSALIVSVKNKTVVTVMDKNALKENVFTNIDSTIVM